MIQVTGAGTENGSPHRAPPKGAAVTGVQVYGEVRVCVHKGCRSISHTCISLCMCLYTFAVVCTFAVCVCVSVHYDSNTL